uniref:Conserved domain protein n=1 Tax=Steinernema glaseri TaxID=37863 RepID=A0A1I7YIP9_9BILA
MRDLFSKSVKRSGHRILTTTKDPPIFGAPYKTDSSENFGRKVLKRK